MKKFVFILFIGLIFSACASHRTADISLLRTGMSKAEVQSLLGPPRRVLAVNRTQHGIQEVLEFRTFRNEVYAVEFWNDYLVSIEYLFDDIIFFPSPAPPAIWPPRGRPIFPTFPNRPGIRPPGRPTPGRPPVRPTPTPPNQNRPDQGRPPGNTGDRPHYDSTPNRNTQIGGTVNSGNRTTSSGGREATTRSSENVNSEEQRTNSTDSRPVNSSDRNSSTRTNSSTGTNSR